MEMGIPREYARLRGKYHSDRFPTKTPEPQFRLTIQELLAASRPYGRQDKHCHPRNQLNRQYSD